MLPRKPQILREADTFYYRPVNGEYDRHGKIYLYQAYFQGIACEEPSAVYTYSHANFLRLLDHWNRTADWKYVAFDRVVNDIDAIDTDAEDQRAELLQEMAEEEHRCLEADEAMSGMKDA